MASALRPIGKQPTFACRLRILDGTGTHNFVPFRDTNPACDPEARYKALGRGIRDDDKRKLYTFCSPDGTHWSLLRDDPLPVEGAFDSQNLAFWDPLIEQYRIYFRDLREGRRDIKTATSRDFLVWTEPVWLSYPGAPAEHLYTNQVMPYYRAPHIYIGFPTRFLKERGSVVEGLFMSSRDGQTFNRWPEAIIRPGRNRDKWGNRSNYIWWGLVETESDIPGASPELSIYTNEAYYEGPGVKTRRYTYRPDGFVSVQAPLSGGEVVTRPLTFGGDRLVVNFSTSAAGSIRAEITDPGGHPIDGFSLADCPEIYGDEIEGTVSWQSESDLGALVGRPVRLRFELKDADIFAFRFSSRQRIKPNGGRA